MKKTVIYTICLTLLLAVLAGCNTANGVREDVESVADAVTHTATPAPAATNAPAATASPMPNVNDGIVNDKDGVIEEKDNGPLEKAPAAATPTAAPSAQPKTTSK